MDSPLVGRMTWGGVWCPRRRSKSLHQRNDASTGVVLTTTSMKGPRFPGGLRVETGLGPVALGAVSRALDVRPGEGAQGGQQDQAEGHCRDRARPAGQTHGGIGLARPGVPVPPWTDPSAVGDGVLVPPATEPSAVGEAVGDAVGLAVGLAVGVGVGVACSVVQSIRSDFLVWTTGVSTLPPKNPSLGQGFASIPNRAQAKNSLPSFGAFWLMAPCWSPSVALSPSGRCRRGRRRCRCCRRMRRRCSNGPSGRTCQS